MGKLVQAIGTLTKHRENVGAGVVAFITAFLDITRGGGRGPLMTPTLIPNGAEPRKAIGTVEFTEPFISFTAVIVFVFTLSLDATFL